VTYQEAKALNDKKVADATVMKERSENTRGAYKK
jgi:hypothetical protein